MNTVGLIVNFLVATWANLIAGTPSLLVNITNGTLEGTTVQTRKGRQIAAFKNIPYALPPVGHLRFQPPQPAEAWSGVRSATEDVPICFQAKNEIFSIDPDNRMTEDCLYLNVYTVETRYHASKSSKKYPVMVWIHGGGFYSGTSHSSLYSPKFLLDHDIVLVTMNYRIEAFGFLSTADSAAYGNQGLKDQVQSLRWVQENIAAFGGDPDNVTIFGESAGAVSVHHLIMSPLTRGLFHRAISQSGTSLNPWTINTQKTAKERAFKLGATLNCPTSDSEEMINCLRTKPAEEIIEISQSWLLVESILLPHFKPVIEPEHPGAFFIEEPLDTLRNGRMADVPWLNGVNANEGSLAVAPLFGLQGSQGVQFIDQQFSAIIPYILIFDESCSPEQQQDVAAKLRRFYFGDQRIDELTRFNLIDLNSDAYFMYGHAVSVKESLKHLKSPIYYYYFQYKSSWSWSKLLGDATRDYGVCHADDLQYLFPIRDVKAPSPYSDEDYQMVDIMTSLWYNFASSGTPTPVDEKYPAHWEPVHSNAFEQLLIEGPSSMRMVQNLHQGTFHFWESLPCPVGLAPRNNHLHVISHLVSIMDASMIVVKIFTWILFSSHTIFASHTVNLKNGTIMGMTMKSSSGREFAAFRGVPYALPPIGPWRFEPPQPSPAWSKIRYTKFDGKKCIHQNVYFQKNYIIGDEDCLYLNIYTPKMEYESEGPNKKYPVMVWFHGGSWSTGSGHSLHYGPQFLLNNDLVLITVNYRLGPFGFLSTGDTVIPGNMGLKDQVHSLRWVQENIEVFGGDPKSVTIFGNGVGAASVHYLMLSPLAKGLFHRAISQSGTVRNPWAFNTYKMAMKSTRRLARDLHCPIGNTEKMLKCLRKIDAKKMAAVELEWPIFDLDPIMPFRPVAEPTHSGAFLTVEPSEMEHMKSGSDVPWMVGTNSDEGIFRVASIYGHRNSGLVEELNAKFNEYAPITLGFADNCPKPLYKKMAKLLRNFYLGDENKKIDHNTKLDVTAMYSDALFNVANHKALHEHALLTTAPIYHYHLTHQSEISYTKFYGDYTSVYGVAHHDEIQYLFPVHEHLFPLARFTDDESKMMEMITTLWFNFAQTGNPMKPDKSPLMGIKWEPVSSEHLEYLLIAGPKNLSMSEDLFSYRIKFWEGLPCPAGIAPSRRFVSVQDEL
ncbi:uncharacterized protein [Fopius arisanus]|uniref:Carboxylesterase type B domain-containing protein n=2 Tax=Fopius arisanus TaxID=64838 RepID=A0A9R1SVG4_9HYME|nr:PREDICTED: uncharacterized protein LOC105263387 [Fopius arisanus]